MTAEILQFIPKPNPTRAYPPNPIEIMAVEILKDEAFKPIDGVLELYHADGSTFGQPIIAGRIVDTAPSEYCAPDGDCA